MTAHIVKLYEEQLQDLSSSIVKMGALAESQLQNAVNALIDKDQEAADETVGRDERIDEMEKKIEEQVLDLIVLRQPMAIDLRETVSAMKISSDLERIGDLAKNIAKRSRSISVELPDDIKKNIRAVADLVQKTLKLVLDSYIDRDKEKAIKVWSSDEQIDNLVNVTMNSIIKFMSKDKVNIKSSTHLLFASKNLERMGDHATNIAEVIYYLVTGNNVYGERPKVTTGIVTG
ncbi:MAG: phosphate signaling complex protein PhoU [Proteobacteria bacterium]|nr:phosphate signaling complex protein PhoU [Pseudomonadota bacterium]